jgi:hypothetical protein
MRSLKGGELRPAKHIFDERFSSVSPLLRPPRNLQRKRPSGRVSNNGCVRGHSFSVSIAYAKFRRMRPGAPHLFSLSQLRRSRRSYQEEQRARSVVIKEKLASSLGSFCPSYRYANSHMKTSIRESGSLSSSGFCKSEATDSSTTGSLIAYFRIIHKDRLQFASQFLRPRVFRSNIEFEDRDDSLTSN